MPPKTRNGGSRQSTTAGLCGRLVIKNLKKQRRHSEEDESERLSVAMTIAALADSFNESRSGLGNVEPGGKNDNVFELCSDSGVSYSPDPKNVSKPVHTLKKTFRNRSKICDTSENAGECFNDLPNDSSNRDSSDHLLPVHLTAISDTFLSNDEGLSTTVSWEKVSNQTNNGKSSLTKKLLAGCSEMPPKTLSSSQEMASTLLQEHMFINNETIKSVNVLPQSVGFVFTPVVMPNGATVLMRIAENQITFLPSMLTCQPNPDQVSSVPQPSRSVFNVDVTNAAQNSPTVSLDMKPLFNGVAEPHASSSQPLGYLDSLQKYYSIEQAKAGPNFVTSVDSISTSATSQTSLNTSKSSTTDTVTYDTNQGKKDLDQKDVHLLGSLKSLREFYSSIQKKNIILEDAVCSVSDKKVLSNVSDKITSVSLPNPAAEKSPDLIIEGVSIPVDSYKLMSCSSGRILPEPRPISQLLSYSSAASLSSDVTECKSPSVEVGGDIPTILLPAMDSVSGVAPKQHSAVEDVVISPPKKSKRIAKSGEIRDTDREDLLPANGSMEKTAKDLMFYQNVLCSKTAEISDHVLVQSEGLSNKRHLLQWQNVTRQSESNHAVLYRDEDGDLPLHVAVELEDVALVEHLLCAMIQLGSSVDVYNNLRQTPLHLAVVSSQATVVKALLEVGASPNCPDQKGFNSLHLAVSYGKTESLYVLLQHSKVTIDINAMNYEGLTPLHLAVKHKHPEYIDILVNSGANVNTVDGKSGHSPLYIAAQTNQLSIAASLLRHGASVQLGSYYGCTPIQAASARAHHAIVKLLLQNGAVETSVSEKVKHDSNEMGNRRLKQKISRHLSITSDISTKSELAV